MHRRRLASAGRDKGEEDPVAQQPHIHPARPAIAPLWEIHFARVLCRSRPSVRHTPKRYRATPQAQTKPGHHFRSKYQQLNTCGDRCGRTILERIILNLDEIADDRSMMTRHLCRFPQRILASASRVVVLKRMGKGREPRLRPADDFVSECPDKPVLGTSRDSRSAGNFVPIR